MTGKVVTSVFEVEDRTDDERYWTLGLFPTLAEALAALAGCDPSNMPGDHDPYDDDYCRIEIRERFMGWSGQGRVLHVMEWRSVYDEEKDTYGWQRVDKEGEK